MIESSLKRVRLSYADYDFDVFQQSRTADNGVNRTDSGRRCAHHGKNEIAKKFLMQYSSSEEELID